MCIQLLPVAQVSTAMYQSQQMNEELPHNDSPVTPSFSEEQHKHFVTATHESMLQLTEIRINEVIHLSEKVNSRFSDDVLTQPPNS
ncbi:MAG TPA: hypothetical protein VFV46_07375 [Lacibacter sp.]|nr:hypothetical protein [Lacibacter sp.]